MVVGGAKSAECKNAPGHDACEGGRWVLFWRLAVSRNGDVANVVRQLTAIAIAGREAQTVRPRHTIFDEPNKALRPAKLCLLHACELRHSVQQAYVDTLSSHIKDVD